MTRKQTQGLWLWAGSLALVLLSIIPLGVGLRVSSLLAVGLIVALGCVRATRSGSSTGEMLAKGDPWPTAGHRQPVVLVCGDGLAGLFGELPEQELALRVTEQGCYVRVPDPEQLHSVAAGIIAMRPEWGGQLSVMHVVNPGEHADRVALASRVRCVDHQLTLAHRRGVELPLILLSYLQGPQGVGPWFSWHAGRHTARVHEAGNCVSLAQWQAEAPDLPAGSARVQTSIQLNSFGTWLAETVAPHLSRRGSRQSVHAPVAFAVTWVPVLTKSVQGNLLQQWLTENTALTGPDKLSSESAAPLPFPDALLHVLPVAHADPRLHPARAMGLWALVMASVIALSSSAWQNTLLVRQVTDDLRRYGSIPAHRHPAGVELREQAVAVLRQDALRLDGYYRHGAPWSLGLGLYHGERLRARVLATLAGHRQPSSAPVPVKSAGAIHLDSLSLFGTGSARLKPESTRVLVNALVDIRAQPGWLIVIAGHTDSTGSAEHNLQLSRARAGAVHDWMLRMSDIPDSCFAVQGFGASQPIASNDTDQGRSANRRVEIRLVPEAGACTPSTANSGVQPRPHSAALHL